MGRMESRERRCRRFEEWKEDEEEPVKRDDHAMDELMYFIMSRPEPHLPERIPESMVVRHKKRLVKQNKRTMAGITC